MSKLTRRGKKTRVKIRIEGYKNGKRILHTLKHRTAVACHFVEATNLAELKIKVVYGRAMTNKNKLEDIIDEVEDDKTRCLKCLKVWLSKSELDFTQKYWGLYE